MLPFKYLGVPLSSRNLDVYQYESLIDKFFSRIRHWTAKLLSYTGSLQLIKSVLFSITAYLMQVFLMPKKVIKKIEAICRRYLWSGVKKKAHIAWDKVCYPKEVGGMNFTSLSEWNIATISKLLWNMKVSYPNFQS